MILHRQNFIEALSILSAENDQIQIRVKGEQAILQTQHTEIVLKTRKVDSREFGVLYCPLTEHNLVFKKLCSILSAVQDEYININFIYDVATDEQNIVVFNDTFKGAFNTTGGCMEHIDIVHTEAKEMFTITDEIYAALSTAKEYCKDETDSVCVSETHIFATDSKTAFLYPNQSPQAFPMPPHVINPRVKGATVYINKQAVYIINRNFKQRVDIRNDRSFSSPAKLNSILEMMKGESTKQTVDCKHLQKSIAIARAMKSETVSLAIHETACIDMYSHDVTGSTMINGSGDDMAAEVATIYAEKILDNPFSQKCDKITIGTHKLVLSLNFNKATFLTQNKAYSARERDVIRRYMNGDESVLLGWSNPYELFKNDYKPWIEVRNEELRRERDRQDREIIAGLRTKIVNIETAKEVHKEYAEIEELKKEYVSRLEMRPLQEKLSSDLLVQHITELEQEEESKERDMNLKILRARHKNAVKHEKDMTKLMMTTSKRYDKIKSQTFILSNTLEQLEAHNADIEAQIQEVLCRQ